MTQNLSYVGTESGVESKSGCDEILNLTIHFLASMFHYVVPFLTQNHQSKKATLNWFA